MRSEVEANDGMPVQTGPATAHTASAAPASGGWLTLGGLVVLVAVTSFAVATVSPWLMLPYLALMGWLTLAPGSHEPKLGGGPALVLPSEPDDPSDPAGSDGRGGELPESTTPAAQEAVEASTKPKRGRGGRGRGKGKLAPATPEPTRVAWVRVGPNQFVRVEEVEPITSDTATPSSSDGMPSATPGDADDDPNPTPGPASMTPGPEPAIEAEPEPPAPETAGVSVASPEVIEPDEEAEAATRPEPPGTLDAGPPPSLAPGSGALDPERPETGPIEVALPVAEHAAGGPSVFGWSRPLVGREPGAPNDDRPEAEAPRAEVQAFAEGANPTDPGAHLPSAGLGESSESLASDGTAAEAAGPGADQPRAGVHDAGTVLPQAGEPVRPGASESAPAAGDNAPEAPSPEFDGEAFQRLAATGDPAESAFETDRLVEPREDDPEDATAGSADPVGPPEVSREVGPPASLPSVADAPAGPSHSRPARGVSPAWSRRATARPRRLDRRASARRPPLARGTPRRPAPRGGRRILRGGLSHDPRAPPAFRQPRRSRRPHLRRGTRPTVSPRLTSPARRITPR